jgi:peptidoglycan/LPS O-acetylase OafA/YrhL
MVMGKTQEQGLVSALTGLRAIAAYFVVLFHYGSSFANSIGVPRPIGKILSNGYLGVSFFFVLSGFILAYNYRSPLTTWSAKKAFFLARFARIYPVYIVALLASFFIGGRFVESVSMGAIPQFMLLQSWIPYTASIQYWNTPGWTLSAEALFYVCFPLAIALAVGSSDKRLGVVACLLAGIMLIAQTPGYGFERSPPAGLGWVPLPLLRLPEFLFGVSLGVLCSRGRLQILGRTPALPAITLAAFGCLAVVPNATVPGPFGVLMGFLIASVFWSAKSRIRRLLSTKLFVLLGGASYSLYLLQVPAHDLFTSVFDGRAKLTMIAYYPIVTLLAILTFVLVEEPAREMIRHFFGMRSSAGAEIMHRIAIAGSDVDRPKIGAQPTGGAPEAGPLPSLPDQKQFSASRESLQRPPAG